MPCVGDWVLVDYYDNNAHAVVYDILPRRTILRRKTTGTRVDYQPIAANIDIAFIVQSCDVDYNLNRLDRYIAVASDGGIDSVLLLTKCDLIDGAKLESIIAEVGKERQDRCSSAEQHNGHGLRQIYEHYRKREDLLPNWILRRRQKHDLEQTIEERRVRNRPRPRNERQRSAYDDKTTVGHFGYGRSLRRQSQYERIGNDWF